MAPTGVVLGLTRDFVDFLTMSTKFLQQSLQFCNQVCSAITVYLNFFVQHSFFINIAPKHLAKLDDGMFAFGNIVYCRVYRLKNAPDVSISDVAETVGHTVEVLKRKEKILVQFVVLLAFVTTFHVHSNVFLTVFK